MDQDTNTPRAMIAMAVAVGLMILQFELALALTIERISVVQVNAVSSAAGLIAVIGVGLGFGVKIMPQRHWAVVLRNGFLLAGGMGFLIVLPYMSFAQLQLGTLALPIFVWLVNAAWGAKNNSLILLVLGFVGYVGAVYAVVYIYGDTTPSFYGRSAWDEALWTWLPFVPVLLTAIGLVATHRLCRTESIGAIISANMVLVLVFSAIGVLIVTLTDGGALTSMIGNFRWPTVTGWMYQIAHAVVSAAVLGLVAYAYIKGNAAQVSILDYAKYPIMAWIGFYSMGQAIPNELLIGSVMIAGAVGATIYLAVSKSAR